LYPNPTTGKFSYNFYSEMPQEVVVTIVNEGGRTFTTEQKAAVKGMNTFEFDITAAAAGKYYIIH
jgi:glycyl-tRNA synthetase beta subunit